MPPTIRAPLFVAVVALSAVAFVGQALAASTTDDTIAVASLAGAPAALIRST